MFCQWKISLVPVAIEKGQPKVCMATAQRIDFKQADVASGTLSTKKVAHLLNEITINNKRITLSPPKPKIAQ
jgi:hypothetical protein